MLEDFQDEQRRQTSKVRSFMDYAMGIIFLLVGLYFLLYKLVGVNLFNREPSSIDYLIGALFFLYGVWRIYRGYKKHYFR